MKRLVVYVGVLLLTLSVGVSSAYLFHKLYIQFECTAVGSLLVEPGGYGRVAAFKSFDGVNLVFESVNFSSHDAAKEAFQSALKDSVRIVERSPLHDREGSTVVGEWVVAVFPSSDVAKTEWITVISLDDVRMYRISSSSLRHIRALPYIREVMTSRLLPRQQAKQ